MRMTDIALCDVPSKHKPLRVLVTAWEAEFEAFRQGPPGPEQLKMYPFKMYGCAETVGILSRHPQAGTWVIA